MAISFIANTGAGNPSGSSVTVTLSSSIQPGDLLLAFVVEIATSTGPAGWSRISSQVTATRTFGLYQRRAVAGDAGGTVTFTNGGANICANVSVWRGPAVLDHAATTTSGFIFVSSLDDPSVVASTTTDMLVAFFVANAGVTFTDPTGMTRAEGIVNTPDTTDICYQTLTSSGATGTRTASIGGTSPMTGVTVALAIDDATVTISEAAPANGATVSTPPTLQVTVSDADPSGSDSVTFFIGTDPTFVTSLASFTTAVQGLPLSGGTFTATMVQLGITLADATTYYWYAALNPGDALVTESTPGRHFTTHFSSPVCMVL